VDRKTDSDPAMVRVAYPSRRPHIFVIVCDGNKRSRKSEVVRAAISRGLFRWSAV